MRIEGGRSRREGGQFYYSAGSLQGRALCEGQFKEYLRRVNRASWCDDANVMALREYKPRADCKRPFLLDNCENLKRLG